MADNSRSFDAGPDPFGRVWHVEFRWLQNAISIRHADTVDVKFVISTPGEPEQEKVIALNHAHLLDTAKKNGIALSDAWCLKLGGAHVRRMVESFEDMDKTLVTITAQDLEADAARLRN